MYFSKLRAIKPSLSLDQVALIGKMVVAIWRDLIKNGKYEMTFQSDECFMMLGDVALLPSKTDFFFSNIP